MTEGDARSPAILLTGADGQVGWELRRSLAPLGRVVALRRSELDLAQLDRIGEVVASVAPAVIVNAAAYTSVDLAESEPDAAFAINALAPRALVESAARVGAAMVHYSTDYVFDGTKPTPYVENDTPAPLSVYGRSKLAGDEAVLGAPIPHLVLRTSWVYGARGRNFLATMLRLAHERTELSVVADQFGAPTPARLIADVTARLLEQAHDGGHVVFPAWQSGLYNVATRGSASWHDFATAIISLDPRRAQQTVQRIRAITTAEYPSPARRPSNSRLDVGKLERTLGIQMPEWRDQLDLVMRELSARDSQ